MTTPDVKSALKSPRNPSARFRGQRDRLHLHDESLPWTGEPTGAARRRYERQKREFVESQTEPLDAWYAAQLVRSHP